MEEKNYRFLLIGGQEETHWPSVLAQALAPLGSLRVVPEDRALQAVVQADCDLAIIDAASVGDAAWLTTSLRAARPAMRVVVATTSPTWQRARKALKAGASDYIQKSLDEKTLRSEIEAALALPHPPRPEGS